MDKKGPIILIDDDEDDLRLLIEIFAELNLPNEIHLFRNTSSVITFLQKPEINPFLIISDISMPVMNGFQLKEMLKNDPRVNRKRIPYLFFSTAIALKVVSKDQEPNSLGIFLKPSKHAEWKETLHTIIKYWTLSLPPEVYEL